jgi:hypothetical protein
MPTCWPAEHVNRIGRLIPARYGERLASFLAAALATLVPA